MGTRHTLDGLDMDERFRLMVKILCKIMFYNNTY